MRLLELHLDRFGCFTDRRIRFRPDAALSVVYGANEAGKSTALAAIADVLYGIEDRSQFKFKHDYTTMRIGATIATPGGGHFSFRRRKGKGVTLLDVNEAPIGEGALAPFLGGVDRALFLDAFGLNRERLRKGANDLIKGGGRVGETLLAAAPGLSSLIALRASLATEADHLYSAKRKVSSLPFWQACERHSDARKQVRQETLHADTVRTAQGCRAEAAEAVGRLRQEQRTIRQKLSRLGRLKHALPRLGRIDRLEAERAALGAIPRVPADFPTRCRAALEARHAFAFERRRLEDETSEASARLEALSVDDALLAQSDAVDRLSDQRATVMDRIEDLPKRQGELTALCQQLDDHARRLGLADREELLARRPPDAAVARARSLINRRRRLADQREERSETLRRIDAEIDDLARRREALGHVADPTSLRRQIEGLAGLPERLAARDELARNLTARQADLDDRLQRLIVPVESADALARLPVPDLGSVEQAVERFDTLAQRRAEGEAEHQRILALQAGIARRLDELKAAGEVATTEALDEARGRREVLWQALRPRLLGEKLPADPLAGVLAYEAAVSHADGLADRRQAEADRIADFRRLTSEQWEREDELAANARSLEAIAAATAEAEAWWNALWSPSGLTPTSPREMRGWLQSRAEILRLLADARAEAARLDAAEGLLATMADRLAALANGLDLDDLAPTELLKATTAAVNAMGDSFNDARALTQEREGCERRRREVEALLGALDRQDAEWRSEWSGAASAVGLREDALEEEAEAALGIWQAVPALEASLRELEHRVERMQEDREAFEAAANELCRAVAPDLGGSAPLAASTELRQRLVKARQAATQREDLRATIAGLEQKAAECRRQEQRNADEIADLCTTAGAPGWDALEQLAARIEQNAEFARQLAEERKALLDADGLSEAELRAEVANVDPDSLSARLDELAEAQEALEARLNEAIRLETRAEAELEAVEAQAGAAAAAQEEQNALADIADIIEKWTTVAAAERLLSASIEAYRAQHQNPLLDRVSEAFAVATGNGFAGIALDFDDADGQRIVAVRHDGARLGVEALSEGTADQLFLALRIATIEDHARRARPLPFIADDLFVTFDDTRTKAGLTLLAELGRTTQTIVFTHHQHVVEAARHVLHDRVETIDLG